jgi:hypothetical protein
MSGEVYVDVMRGVRASAAETLCGGSAAADLGGLGRDIGFVVCVYHKLPAMSEITCVRPFKIEER